MHKKCKKICVCRKKAVSLHAFSDKKQVNVAKFEYKYCAFVTIV